MKKLTTALILFFLVFFVAGCSAGKGLVLGFDSPESFPPLETLYRAPITEELVTLPSGEPSPEQPKPVHSDIYVENVSVEEIITYFNEVWLLADENGASYRTIQKWESPIYYQINGVFTEDDITMLNYVFEVLNSIEGFPGIAQATEQGQVNFQIYFCSEPEMVGLLGQSFASNDGGALYWHEEDAINRAVMCCRTDLDQYLRNTAILKNLYKCFGVLKLTDTRPDSVVYNGVNEAQELSSVDETLLRIMYSGKTMYGMTAADTERVIRLLYY